MGSVAGTSAASIWQQADAADTTNSDSSNTTGTNALSNTSAFLQLLVAQLQNQDPTQPMDPTTFVTQLAEFNDVQQNLGSRQDLDAMSEKYLGVTTPPSGGTGDSTTDATSDSSSNQTDASSGTSSS